MRTYIHKNVIDNEYLHSLSGIKTNKKNTNLNSNRP